MSNRTLGTALAVSRESESDSAPLPELVPNPNQAPFTASLNEAKTELQAWLKASGTEGTTPTKRRLGFLAKGLRNPRASMIEASNAIADPACDAGSDRLFDVAKVLTDATMSQNARAWQIQQSAMRTARNCKKSLLQSSTKDKGTDPRLDRVNDLVQTFCEWVPQAVHLSADDLTQELEMFAPYPELIKAQGQVQNADYGEVYNIANSFAHSIHTLGVRLEAFHLKPSEVLDGSRQNVSSVIEMIDSMLGTPSDGQ